MPLYKIVHVCTNCNGKANVKSSIDRKKLICLRCGKDTIIQYAIPKDIYKNMNITNFIRDELDKYYIEHPEKRPVPSQPQPQPHPKPKCPTCGTENIRKISDAERGANAFMFGLMGNKRKYQFECMNPNCKYKW